VRERPILVLFALTLIVIGGLYAANIRIPISIDQAIQRELHRDASTEQLNTRIRKALAKDDIETADMYADIAKYMARPLAPDVTTKLAEAHSTLATVTRDSKDFATGFVTGQGESTAGIAGAVTSDFTVVGDVRDISAQGKKMVAGQSYSKLVLGLSLVGLAATVATVATGGGGAVAKVGVSVLKAAKRAGTLTADFARTLRRMVEDAVDFREVGRITKTTDLADMRASEHAFSEYARGIKTGKLMPVVKDVAELGENAGPAETVRLMRFVHSERDLDDITRMSKKLGGKTRGVVALTGKTALRAFRTTLNIFEYLAMNILAFAGWIGGLLGLGLVRRAAQIIRRPAVS
jgi:hypothetical protein